MGNGFDDVYFCAVLFPEMSWMRYGIVFSLFLGIFLSTLLEVDTQNMKFSQRQIAHFV